MKTIVIGDIHGCYNELRALVTTLKQKGEYDERTDKIVFLGDYIDRGKDSRKVIGFIKNLQKRNKNVIALMGNHEDMFLGYLKGVDDSWTYNGHEATIESYKGHLEHFNNDIEWIGNLPLYHEDEHFIYVHAGVDVYKTMEEQSKHTLLWVREPFIYNSDKYYKQVIFGHTPTLNLNFDSKPVYTVNDNLAIDTGCVFGGALTALIIEDGEVKKFFQQEKIAENNVSNNKKRNNKKNRRNNKKRYEQLSI